MSKMNMNCSIQPNNFVIVKGILGIPDNQVRLVRINDKNELYINSDNGDIFLDNYAVFDENNVKSFRGITKLSSEVAL